MSASLASIRASAASSQRAVKRPDAWSPGRKRFPSWERAALQVFEPDGQRIKVNPLASWTGADVTAYAARHDLPEHPLVSRGYPSIGCIPCTTKVEAGDQQRVHTP